jgi:hypothetical protein
LGEEVIGMWCEGRLDLTDEARRRAPALRDPDELRDAVIGTWHGRMVNEWMSSYVFSGLADQLAAIGDAQAAAQCREFADEEREHGRLCGAVVVAVRGEARAAVPPPRPLPVHARTTPRAAVVRNLISIACLSETVAVALIGAERLEMSEGPLRELLTRIWADEVGHARFGWTWLERALPDLDDEERAAVNAYLPYALGHLEAHELAHLPAASEPPIAGRQYGVCSGRAARALFYDTVHEVIVPSLERRGLAATHAWRERKAA